MFNRRTGGRSMAGLLGLLVSAALACTPLAALAVVEEQAAAAQARDELIDGIIVRFRTAQTGVALNARVRAAQVVAAQRGLTVSYLRSGALGIHVLRLGQKIPLADVEELAKQIAANDPIVEYAEPDGIVHALFAPNDPRYNEQWHYFEATGGINLPAAWDQSRGANVVVAVIDTGYRPHTDLAANIVAGYDFITSALSANDGNGRDADARDPGDWVAAGVCDPLDQGRARSSWHGTHVSGTVAALTNNSTGVAGVAFEAKVLPARVLGRCGGTDSDVADAIVWASGGSVTGVPANASPARVLNLSLGRSGSCSTTFQNAINSARSRNSVVVVSAGNSNADAANSQPANCSGVITVAATNRNGAKASYSNFGATVEIAAPGGRTNTLANGVLSTLNAGNTTPGADSYQFYQGTSMAAPHVSGVVALLLSKNGTLTPNQCLAFLQSTARPFPGSCSQCGSGIVHAAAAVNAVSAPGVPSAPTSLRVDEKLCNGNYRVTWNASTGQVDNYELYFDNDPSFSSPGLHSSGTSLTRTFAVGPPGTVRYLRVRACNGNGCSGYSNTLQLNGFSGCGP
jgi:serine protease